MTKRTEIIKVTLPAALISELKAIAKLAGLSAETVIRVALATETHRHAKRVPPPAA